MPSTPMCSTPPGVGRYSALSMSKVRNWPFCPQRSKFAAIRAGPEQKSYRPALHVGAWGEAGNAGLCQMPGGPVEPAGRITERIRTVDAAADVDDESVCDAVVHAAAALRIEPNHHGCRYILAGGSPRRQRMSASASSPGVHATIIPNRNHL